MEPVKKDIILDNTIDALYNQASSVIEYPYSWSPWESFKNLFYRLPKF